MALSEAFLPIRNQLTLLTPKLFIRKPLFLIRITLKLLSQKYFNAEKLTGVDFAIGYKCNFRCRHCYETKFRKTSQKLLTLEEKKRVIKECLSMGVVAFDFIGGETTLHPEFPELVRACKPSKTYISVASNGFDLPEEKLRYFYSIGIDKINLSIDSWNPVEHDYNRRKKGSHQRVFETIELCKKIGLDVCLSIVVFKNYTKTEGFNKMVEYALKNKIKLYCKLAVPIGEWEGNYDKLITQEDRNLIIRLHKKYPYIKICFDNCLAFQKTVAITAYGDVMPCTCVHISFGNLRNESLESILKRGRKNKYFDGQKEAYHLCPSAEDREFIEKFLSKTYMSYPYPPKCEDIFGEKKAEYESNIHRT